MYLWKKEWLDKSFELLKKSPKTIGIYLTKAPNKIKLDDVPDNAWMGVTITSKSDLWRLKALKENIKCKNYHVTFEPLFEDLGDIDLSGIQWIVIGTETGKCKGKIDAKRNGSIIWWLSLENTAVRFSSRNSSFITSWAKKTQSKSSH